MAGKKIPTKTRCSADSEAIITTRVGSFELQDKAALTDIGIVIIHTVVHFFLQLYDIQKVEFLIPSNRCNVWVEYGIANRFQSKPTIDASKLTSYALAELILCIFEVEVSILS